MMLKPDRDISIKLQTNNPHEYTVDAKILYKTSAKLIQQFIKSIIHHDKLGFSLGMSELYNALKSINVIYY